MKKPIKQNNKNKVFMSKSATAATGDHMGDKTSMKQRE